MLGKHWAGSQVTAALTACLLTDLSAPKSWSTVTPSQRTVQLQSPCTSNLAMIPPSPLAHVKYKLPSVAARHTFSSCPCLLFQLCPTACSPLWAPMSSPLCTLAPALPSPRRLCISSTQLLMTYHLRPLPGVFPEPLSCVRRPSSLFPFHSASVCPGTHFLNFNCLFA